MNPSEDVLEQALESAEEKLRVLESEQEDLETKITQTKAEIKHLVEAIASLEELQGQLQ